MAEASHPLASTKLKFMNMAHRDLVLKISLGIVSASLLASPVFAQDKPLKRQPEGQLQIKEVGSAQTGDKPYCVMIQSYNNASKLTVSRNYDGQSALAFDAGKAFLEPSKNYKASLNIGKDETYRYEISPLSASEFIIRMDKETNVFERIQASDRIKIGLADRILDIELPDMGKVARNLSGCIERVSGETKVVDTQQSKNDSKDTTLAKLRSENEDLRQSLKNVRKKLENAQAQSAGGARVAEMREKIDQLDTKLAKARQKQADDNITKKRKKKLEALRADKRALTGDLENLRQDLSEEKSARKTASQKVRKLEEKISSLEQAEEKYSQKQKKLEVLRTDKEELRQDLEGLRQELAEEKSARKTASQKVQKLEKALSETSKSLQEQEKKSKKIASLRSANADLREELESVRQDLKAAQAQTVKKERLAAIKGKNSKLQDKLARFKDEKNRLKQKQQQIQQEKSRLQKRLDEQSRRHPRNEKEIASLREERRNLEQKLNATQYELDAAQSRLAKRSTQECNITEQDHVAPERLKDLKSRLSTLREKNRRLKNDLSASQSRLETALAQNDADSVSADNENRTAIAKRYNEAQREIRRLGGKLRKKRQSCQQEIKELEEMLFNPELADSKQISVLNKLERQLKQARARIDKLKSQQNKEQADKKTTGPVAVSKPVQRAPVAQQSESDERRENRHKPASKPVDLNDKNKASSVSDVRDEKGAIGRLAQDLQSNAKIYTSANAVSGLLSRADIDNKADIRRIEDTDNDIYAAYQWSHDSVYGSAKFRTLGNKQSYSDAVDRYIAQVRSRCPADFSARPVPDSVPESAPGEVSAYDIACVGEDVDNVASIAFLRDSGNNFGVIALETASDRMSKAMQLRDALMKAFASTKTAQR